MSFEKLALFPQPYWGSTCVAFVRRRADGHMAASSSTAVPVSVVYANRDFRDVEAEEVKDFLKQAFPGARPQDRALFDLVWCASKTNAWLVPTKMIDC